MADARVVHLASGREWRGGQRQVLLLARGLAREGVAQSVVTGRGSELARRLAAEGLPLVPAPWSAAYDPRVLPALLRQLHPGTIVHAHDAHALALATIAARLRGARVVATRRVDFALRRPYFWRRADAVIAISEAVRAVLRQGGVADERITVVPSAVDLDATRGTTPADLAQAFGIPAGAPVAVSVAALVAHKDPALLLDAAERLRAQQPALHWLLLGDGPLRPALEARIAERGLGTHLHLTGWRDDVLPCLAAATLCVASSREEGLNTSVLDALALGIPVVATRAGGLPEAVGEAGVLVPPADGVALADAVHQLLGDAALQARLRAAGPAQAERFALPRMAAGVRSVYRSLR